MAAEIINLNDLAPAAPAGAVNVGWQKGAQSGTDPTTGYPVYPVSAYLPIVWDDVPSGARDGSNTTFTLSQTPLSATALFFFRNGLKQILDVDFTLSGNTITTTSAPAANEDLIAMYPYVLTS